ncbi:hypothetical protein BDA96_07G096200 [Sorghum bicolor]|uniref:3-beta hydroxysteroid dehydrogenase/isomerase domain-containing protein n=1 Tax=Sorghum bicolor TaxID=4558 RepID=A0A921QJZ6_SORBI|nr:hypothetical protein BDA96_07G096200 [Sorghum bicolor]
MPPTSVGVVSRGENAAVPVTAPDAPRFFECVGIRRSTGIRSSPSPWCPLIRPSVRRRHRRHRQKKISRLKNTHLRALPNAAERLALCNADLLDYDVLRAGCHGVFHTASSVTDDPWAPTAPNARRRGNEHGG